MRASRFRRLFVHLFVGSAMASLPVTAGVIFAGLSSAPSASACQVGNTYSLNEYENATAPSEAYYEWSWPDTWTVGELNMSYNDDTTNASNQVGAEGWGVYEGDTGGYKYETGFVVTSDDTTGSKTYGWLIFNYDNSCT